MMQVAIGFIPANPLDAFDGKRYYTFLRTEKGGAIVVGETMLICDDCGAEIEKGDTYFAIEYPPWNVVCEDCIMRAETVRGDETNYKIVSEEQIL